jgi:hypothetical protein
VKEVLEAVSQIGHGLIAHGGGHPLQAVNLAKNLVEAFAGRTAVGKKNGLCRLQVFEALVEKQVPIAIHLAQGRASRKEEAGGDGLATAGAKLMDRLSLSQAR